MTRFKDVEVVLDKFLYKRAVFCRPFLEVWEEVVNLNVRMTDPSRSESMNFPIAVEGSSIRQRNSSDET